MKGYSDDILMEIYKAERNIQLSWFWDGGFDIKIGDPGNGFTAEANFETLREAIEWAHQQVFKGGSDNG